MTNKAFFVAWLCTFRLQSYVLLYCHKHQYIGETVTLKIYSTSVKIYHKQQFLCEHTTKGTRPGAYSTNEHHLPEESNPVGKWNRTRYLEWTR